MLWYVFPVNPEISWEGHLSGFFVGLLFAFYFKSNPVQNKKYDWERDDYNPDNDPFLKQFDENGNFIELPKELPNEPSIDETVVQKPRRIKIIYSYKKNSEKKPE
jgi:hypothetical protein